jgi:hypothetical protein
MSYRSSRPGLFWVVVLTLLAVAGLDLVRGRDSLLRSWWTGLPQSRGEQTRSLIEQVFRRNDRTRGR